jgi:hypothetical protein
VLIKNMWCGKCQKHLSECTCEDLKERLEELKNCPHIYISPDVLKQYEEQAERNKWPELVSDAVN